jgi:uncharacterized protein YlxW (UPF0749 family)
LDIKSLLKVKTGNWVWQVTILSFVLGMLLAAALKTQIMVKTASGIPTTRFSSLAQVLLDEKDHGKLLQAEITDLRSKLDKYETSRGQDTAKAKLLSSELKDTKLLAGLVPVEGEGVEVTVRDVPGGPPSGTPAVLQAEYIVHDIDLRNIVNELFANGAEAISVSDGDTEQRIIAVTAIRCVGGPIQVNRVPMSPPFLVKAIGPQSTMAGGLKMPNGLIDNWHALPGLGRKMIKIKKSNQITVPAFSGNTSSLFLYSRPVESGGGAM